VLCYISSEATVDIQSMFTVRGQLNYQTHVSCSNWQC
jgi:hypothetical protein